jgi:serine/threonine protein kinase
MSRQAAYFPHAVGFMKLMRDKNIPFTPTDRPLCLLQIKDKDSKHGVTRFYGFEAGDIIGEGAYGKVYKAYAIDPASGFMSLDKCVVVKIMDAKHFKNNEHEIASKFLPLSVRIDYEKKILLVQPYLGKPLESHPDLGILSPKNLLSLIKNLVFKFNEMHHETLRTGIIIVHGDVKPGNILLNLVFDPKNPDTLIGMEVNPIDFGLSQYMCTDDSKYTHDFGRKGNGYFPEETKTPVPGIGIKSDIYQLAGVIAYLLGFRGKDHAILQSQYRLENLTKIKEFKFTPTVEKIFIDFLNKMRHADYRCRPESDEVLKFFQLLDKYFKTNSAILSSQFIQWDRREQNKSRLEIQEEMRALAQPSQTPAYSSSSSSSTGPLPGDEKDSAVVNTFTSFRLPKGATSCDPEMVVDCADLLCLK